jgi:hypothetical protein
MLVSTTLHSLIPGRANPATPCRHNTPVLETANLARSLVCPAGLTAPEMPPPAIAVSRRIGVRRDGPGGLPTTSHPAQKNLRPKGPPSSLPGSWSAVTTKEAGSTKQSSSSSPGSKESAPCSQFWRGAAVHATLFLGCTVCCGSIGTMRWGREVIVFTITPAPHSCHSYSTRVPLLR